MPTQRPKVYCIGLRNVWKFSFDRQTGELWAGEGAASELCGL